MQLNLGIKIRELRNRDNRTQEALAAALGVTSQAVSRWESNGSYPDMEIIPSIANYFGITIDELFGYQSDRDKKIDEIINAVESFSIKSRGDDKWVDECVMILRNGLAEFPQNERLLITLADTLSEAGWRRHKEWVYYDEDGYIQHSYDRHKQNDYWAEAVKICENLVHCAKDNTIVTRAINILVLLYRNFGETEKAVSCAMKMPSRGSCKEILLASATDGKEEANYIGDFLLKAAAKFSTQLVYGLIANKNHYNSDMPIEKVKGAISIFYLICEDGNFGPYHGNLIQLYLYLSRLQWERGYKDDAFKSLDNALKHAQCLDEICDGNTHYFTAPLVLSVEFKAEVQKKAAKSLPDDWPAWCMPDYTKVAAEIKQDKRWHEWVMRTQE